MRLLTRLCCALAVALIPLLSSSLTPKASAANFTVNSLGDTSDANVADGLCADAVGACTLRAAIEQANANASSDVISIGVTGTINLNSALPDLSTSMTINGPGAAQLTVRRASGDYRIFTVVAATVAISGLTVSNGRTVEHQILLSIFGSGEPGGGVFNSGVLTLTGCVISGNRTGDLSALATGPPGDGGGIYNEGTLTMTDCNVTNNSTGADVNGHFNGGNGGGIFNTGTLTMTGSSVTFNTTGRGADSLPTGGFARNGGAGGGIYNAPNGARQVSATLTNCNVSENVTGGGGKIVNGAFASLSQSGNGGAGGGVYNASNMTISSSFVSGNMTGVGANVDAGIARPAGKGGAGGGVYNDIPASGGEMKLVNCVVSGNKTGKGGVGNGMTLSEGDGGDGGGIANPSDSSVLKVSQSTIVFNETGLMGDGGGRDGVGGGLYGAASVRSNIIALNLVRFPTTLSDVAGNSVQSLGYNFLGFFGTLHFTNRDRGGSNAGPLALLDSNTLIPQPGSLVIDAGLARDTDGNAVTNDIRGGVRPFDFPTVAPQIDGDNSDIGAFERQATDTPLTPTTVQFASTTGHVPEGCVQADITVTRSGPKDGTTTAEYFVTDSSDTGAHWRGDFTYARGKVTFAPGEDTKTIPVLLTEDAYHEQPEEFIAHLVGVEGGQLGAPDVINLTIDDNDATDGAANPIDDNATFVCQQYHDFLSRQADPGGQAFWTAQLDACGGAAACLDRKRVDVSAAFFLSIEFQNTGYYVIRINKLALGDFPDVPTFLEFEDEAQDVARGVIVGQPGYEAVLEANKQRYAEAYVQRGNFQAAHGAQTAAQFVDSLFANVGAQPSTAERDAAISAFGAGGFEGQTAALRSITESGAVYNKLYNEAFVLMQYYAYLRRNPNDPPDTNFDGYNFWLAKLDSFTQPGEDARDETVAIRRVRRAEMIRAFLLSDEYRGRFGGDASRGNP